jgi:hypothetical protein
VQDGQRCRHRRVAAEARLVGRAVGPDECGVDGGLVERVAVDEQRGDLVSDSGQCGADVEPAEPRSSVALVDRFAAAARGAGGRDASADAAVGEFHLDLDRGTAPRIPDTAGVNRANRRLGHQKLSQ